MRITVTKIDKENDDYGILRSLLGQSFIVEDWLVKKNGIPQVRETKLMHTTEKAYLFIFKNKQQWIPKSCCAMVEQKEKGLERFDCE